MEGICEERGEKVFDTCGGEILPQHLYEICENMCRRAGTGEEEVKIVRFLSW